MPKQRYSKCVVRRGVYVNGKYHEEWLDVHNRWTRDYSLARRFDTVSGAEAGAELAGEENFGVFAVSKYPLKP